MKVKDAVRRALRAAIWTFVGSVPAAPTIETLSDVKLVGSVWFFALMNSSYVFVIAFVVNVAEDNTGLNLGKGGDK